MTNLEKAIIEFSKLNIEDDLLNFNIIGLLNLASEHDWKYPEKGEYPENHIIVIIVFSNKRVSVGLYTSDYKQEGSNNNPEGRWFFGDYSLIYKEQVIAWCELPKYNH